MLGSSQDRHSELSAELFIRSQWYVCGVVTITAKGLVVDAPVDTSGAVFARLHLHGAEEDVLDLDVMVCKHAASPRSGHHCLLVAYVEPPEHLLGALARLARGSAPAEDRRATPRRCDERRAAVTGRQSLSEIDTSPQAMLEIYREATGETGPPSRSRDEETQKPRSLWSKLKKVATTKL